MKRLATFCSAVAFGLVACGDQPPNSAHPAARERLISGVQQVRVATSGQDRPAAETALAALIRDVASAQARGELDAESARTILQAADRVSEDVRAMDGPPAPPPIVVRVPVRVPQPRPPQPRPPREPSGISAGERPAVAPPADPPAAQPAQRAPGNDRQPARDVPPPQSGSSGQQGQIGQGQIGQGQNGQGQNGQGQNRQGQNDQGEDD